MPADIDPRRRQGIVLGVLLVAALLAWAFLIADPLVIRTTPMPASWNAATAFAAFLMWSILMAAIMLPSAAAMVLMVARQARWPPASAWHVWLFVAAYLAVWTGFGALATAVHRLLQTTGLVSTTMVSIDTTLTAVLLIGAGLFQFTTMKAVCLSYCRAPDLFRRTQWRGGAGGGVAMGLRYGLYSVGCCWMLMPLLFVGGVMTLPWAALLAVAIATEMLAPRAEWMVRLYGGALVLGGLLAAAIPTVAAA